VEKDTERDFWLTPEEAKTYRIIDEIIKSPVANIKKAAKTVS